MVKKAKKFPWLVVLLGTAALGAGIYFLTAKKKEEPAQDVTLNLDVFNHTKTLLKDDYKLTVKAGSSVTITFNQLAVTGVVKDYLILRNAHSGADLGSYVTSSDTSSVTFTAPNSNTNYDLFLLNDGPAASLYGDLWDGRHDKRIWNCYRLDWNQEGPQEPWNDAFARLRSGLTKNGIEYGKIILVPGTTGDLRYGYYDYGGFGWHDIVGKWISVNTDKCPSNS